jgi:SAM-dependent methyltransferase
MYDTEFARSSIGSKRFTDLAKNQVEFLDAVLGLNPNAKILDVPCGTGRHSVLFARKGYQVTGVDISRDCLRIAKAGSRHKNVRYLHGDMSRLQKFRGSFDAVLNLFTSFGYFATDKENEAVLKQMASTLRPGGKLVLNLIDRDWIMKIYQPARWTEENGVMTLEASKYDPVTKYNESQMVIIDKKKSKPVLKHYHYHRVRLYSNGEILRLMKKVGLRDVKVWGDFDGNKYSKGRSTHPIYIGTKP